MALAGRLEFSSGSVLMLILLLESPKSHNLLQS